MGWWYEVMKVVLEATKVVVTLVKVVW